MAEKPSLGERLEMIKSPRFFHPMLYLQFFIRDYSDQYIRYCQVSLAK